ncbi:MULTISPECIES: flagellar assembly peptidoglycan hydrolase FlgJ [Ramlibacter]|uniref:Peptidoglycan hydrolase FlgJ n=1 Tax=Ramlibacter aquaticus TaxID=2780094 RepID=A0ABR9SGS1_9BURK|nr:MULTISPECIES: flagellar assembly peptidoglycan hydrolase FlgJ [Ramlibacter]MBE7941546.1 flagellar assembly peptidoglycan hydrolase FlgJ [Ramlibacter aquaticus]
MLTSGGDSLGVDARKLDALRGEAARDPKAAARQAAVQFEGLFMQMVLKSMRDATPKADGSPSQDTFTGMFDSRMAQQFAGRPHGLADVLEQQLTRHMHNLPAPSPENVAAAQAAAVAQAQQAAAARAAQGLSLRGAAAAGPLPAAGAATASQPAAQRAADFIQKMLPHAQEAERATGVPASFILGQAALESGWGRHEARNADGSSSFNLFGIKAGGSWQGASTDAMTTEYTGGQAVRQKAGFRSYGSYAEAFTDYARMLAASPRYSAVRGASTAEAFAGGMQRAGYATDPQYAAKLARTINHTLALQRAMA